MAWCLTLFGAPLAPTPVAAGTVIALAPGSAPRLRLAAREVQRYVYLRAGEVLPIAYRDVPPEAADWHGCPNTRCGAAAAHGRFRRASRRLYYRYPQS